MDIRNNTSPNFGSGLSSGLRRSINNIDVRKAEEQFKRLGVDAHFDGSKTFAGCSTYVAEIMDEISKRFHLPFDALPPSINVTKKVKRGSFGICITDTGKINNEGPDFIGRSIFIRKPIFDSPVLLDIESGFDHKIGYSSSPHFLSNPLHEWFHNIHLDLIYKKHGYEGECPVMKARYGGKEKPDGIKTIDYLRDSYFSTRDKKYAEEKFGYYSVKDEDFLEFFAELMTQITAKSLDKNLKVTKNPLDNIPKDLPEFFKRLVDKTLNI